MASIRLTPGTLTGTLWPANKEPTPKSNGLFLQVVLDCMSCTALVSDPADVLRHAVASSDGSVFLFQMKKKRVVMAAKLPSAVTAVAFAPLRRDHIFCACGQSVFQVNLETCRIDKKTRSPHYNNIHHIACHAALPTTMLSISVDAVALWDTNTLACRHNSREDLKGKASASNFVDGALTERGVYTVEAVDASHGGNCGGIVTLWTPTDLTVVKKVSLPEDKVPSSIAVSDSFVVVANGAATEVMILDLSLKAISTVVLPGSASVRRVSVVDTDLFAAQTADGRVWYVVASKYAVSFTLAFPFTTPLVAMASAGATYVSAATAKDVVFYHLPSVKRFYDRNLGGGHAVKGMGRASVPSVSSILPFVRTNSDATPDVPAEACESYEAELPRQPMDVDEATAGEWIKANLVNQHDAACGAPKTLLLKEAVRQMHAEGGRSEGASRLSNRAAEAGLAATTGHSLHRATASAAAKSTTASAAATAAKKKSSNTTSGGTTSTNALPREVNIAARTFLDHESRAVNMDKLRVMLMRYGMYPEKYRTLIWRFLLQLPEKRFLAPQYAALTEKGPHPGVETLLEPFPLPKNKQRATFEAALSALAWNSPLLSVVHFSPNLLFPFVQLYGSDTQSAIEVCLSVLVNWGREFFTYYPHHPVAILSYLNHTLKSEDAELFHHLEECGVGVDVWGWEVMCPLYTEILTRNEWLQVMDHAFSNEPLWLFLFHVRWMVQLREVLMQLHDHAQLVSMFRKATPMNLNTIIHQTYRLRQRCVLGSIAEPYLSLTAFRDFAYPVFLECDEAVITTKLRELERIAEQQEEAKASKHLVTDIKSRIAQAAVLEDAFVWKQRAMVAAKMEASNESWVQQVQLEKERQRLRDIEHETRLLAIQEQLRSAQRLESLQHEVNAASQSARDADVDRQREVTKWDFSDRMTLQEMERLEVNARMKLQSMLRTAASLSDGPDGGIAADVVAMAARDNAVPPILPDSLINEHIAQTQQQRGAATPPPPPPPPPPRDATPQRAVHHQDPTELRDGQTMTELPPLPPPSTRSDSSSAKPASIVPQPFPPGAAQTAPADHQPASSADTSCAPQTSSSTCDSDPMHYYQQLQRTIKEGVERAQREQKQRLGALESRFARQLGSDDGSSEVTEPVIEDESTATTSSGTDSSKQQRSQQYASAAVAGRRPVTHALHDNMESDTHDRVQRHTTTTTSRRYQSHDETCSLLASSAASTSMTTALLRPQDPDFFTMHRGDKRGDEASE